MLPFPRSATRFDQARTFLFPRLEASIFSTLSRITL